MPEIERLRPDHAGPLLAFEKANRAYFAASVPDRGDAYFAEFEARLAALLAEQDAGICHFHVLTGPDGEVLGRVNLVDAADGSADLGYRIAEHATGRGLATAAVRRVCELAVTAYGLTTLHAVTTVDNTASQAVLARTGFRPTGTVPDLSGRPGLRFVRDLTAEG
ncbi:GNAT family N-acetyltransferase [Streptomyces sp. NPDC089919]|uniref:GNAT family N-acetyltransferase n=1 Tax=Streptomyces sp. NPDC089919 TaxID=3155188 RepID=UPI003423346E